MLPSQNCNFKTKNVEFKMIGNYKPRRNFKFNCTTEIVLIKHCNNKIECVQLTGSLVKVNDRNRSHPLSHIVPCNVNA